MTTASEVARLRQGLYRYFANAFAAPEPVLLEQLKAAAGYLDAMDIADYSFSREWRDLVEVIESDVAVATLAPVHVRLFASGVNGVLCPPIESFYRVDGRTEAIANVVAAIQNDYGKMGLSISPADAPDHVSTQLQIMSTLCGHESAAWEVGAADDFLDTEATFLRRHLAGWLPKLRVRVHAAGPNDFYAALLDAVHSFVIHDEDLLAGLRRWSGAVS
jgi:TorA maturation chaperone TorD